MDYKLETIDYFSDGHKGLYDGIAQLTKSINNTYPGHFAVCLSERIAEKWASLII